MEHFFKTHSPAIQFYFLSRADSLGCQAIPEMKEGSVLLFSWEEVDRVKGLISEDYEAFTVIISKPKEDEGCWVWRSGEMNKHQHEVREGAVSHWGGLAIRWFGCESHKHKILFIQQVSVKVLLHPGNCSRHLGSISNGGGTKRKNKTKKDNCPLWRFYSSKRIRQEATDLKINYIIY